jgi:hypothetical protein
MSFKEMYARKFATIKQKARVKALVREKAEAWLLEIVKEAEEAGLVVEDNWGRAVVKNNQQVTICRFDIYPCIGLWTKYCVTAHGYGPRNDFSRFEGISSKGIGFAYLRSRIHDFIIKCAAEHEKWHPTPEELEV